MIKHNRPFYVYEDVDIDFKEQNNLSRNDTGIDIIDMESTIVQCKLRSNTICLNDIATFLASQNVFDENINETVIRWKKLILARNDDSKLSRNVMVKYKLFDDEQYKMQDMLNYCDNISPVIISQNSETIELRDYQIEAINFINNNGNSTICLPTGTGKNVVIIYSIPDPINDKKILILVPRIILAQQMKEEILKYKPHWRHNIQCVSCENTSEYKHKNITICVYNSINKIIPHINSFHKIYIDEAHNINKPFLYIDDDEYCGKKTEESYITSINKLKKYNNNVLLSATIDEIDGIPYYYKDIRDMINAGIICDYNIHIPVFNNDPSKIDIAKYLVENYRSMIIYCNSRDEGIKFKDIVNSLLPNSTEYIDCYTKLTERNKIIDEFKNGNLAFIVNIRVLIEGFNVNIVNGVLILSYNSSENNIIQIIGRALRKHQNKKIAHIIMPYTLDIDSKYITRFVKSVVNNDKRIRKSMLNKNKNPTYVEMNNVNAEWKYDIIYENLDILLDYKSRWVKRLSELKNYIDNNGKKPLKNSEDLYIKKLANWLRSQSSYYKNNSSLNFDKHTRKLWCEFINDKTYSHLFDIYKKWIYKLDKIKEYIDLNGKVPPKKYKDKYLKNVKPWLLSQTRNYNKKKGLIFENEEIYQNWVNFIKKYGKFIESFPPKKLWLNNFDNLIKFINLNKKMPSLKSDDETEILLAKWTKVQRYRYNNKKMNYQNSEKWKELIGDDTLYNIVKNKKMNYQNSEKWKESIGYVSSRNMVRNKLPKRVNSTWFINLVKLKKFLDDNNRKPEFGCKGIEIKLYQWFTIQKSNYKLKKSNMKKKIYCAEWDKFIGDEKYMKYFLHENKLTATKKKVDYDIIKESFISNISCELIKLNGNPISRKDLISKCKEVSNNIEYFDKYLRISGYTTKTIKTGFAYIKFLVNNNIKFTYKQKRYENSKKYVFYFDI
jgi:superfamily II DNA or RNA helicase